jgi:hypothetical protein
MQSYHISHRFDSKIRHRISEQLYLARAGPGDLYQANGIQLCCTLLDLYASPVAQTARHRGHVLAPRAGTSELAITQAKIVLDTQYMP